ncbi:MAG: hypothetical protein ACP5D7_03080 [Limnospira sp.]
MALPTEKSTSNRRSGETIPAIAPHGSGQTAHFPQFRPPFLPQGRRSPFSQMARNTFQSLLGYCWPMPKGFQLAQWDEFQSLPDFHNMNQSPKL